MLLRGSMNQLFRRQPSGPRQKREDPPSLTMSPVQQQGTPQVHCKTPCPLSPSAAPPLCREQQQRLVEDGRQRSHDQWVSSHLARARVDPANSKAQALILINEGWILERRHLQHQLEYAQRLCSEQHHPNRVQRSRILDNTLSDIWPTRSLLHDEEQATYCCCSVSPPCVPPILTTTTPAVNNPVTRSHKRHSTSKHSPKCSKNNNNRTKAISSSRVTRYQQNGNKTHHATTTPCVTANEGSRSPPYSPMPLFESDVASPSYPPSCGHSPPGCPNPTHTDLETTHTASSTPGDSGQRSLSSNPHSAAACSHCRTTTPIHAGALSSSRGVHRQHRPHAPGSSEGPSRRPPALCGCCSAPVFRLLSPKYVVVVTLCEGNYDLDHLLRLADSVDELRLSYGTEMEMLDDITLRYGSCPVSRINDVPPQLFLRSVQERLTQCDRKWRAIGRDAKRDLLTVADAYPLVVRNLSVMRIFLEGSQAAVYGSDIHERGRRDLLHRSVLDKLQTQRALFLDEGS